MFVCDGLKLKCVDLREYASSFYMKMRRGFWLPVVILCKGSFTNDIVFKGGWERGRVLGTVNP